MRSWHPFGLTAAIGVVALLALGLHDERSRAFSLEAPNQQPVAVLAPRQSACEGPVISTAPVDAVRVWGAAAGSPTALDVFVTAGGKLLSSGRIVVSTMPNSYTIVLSGSIAGHRALSVCLSNGGLAPFSLLGSPSVDPAVRMTVANRRSPLQFSLVLLAPPTSSLSQLSSAFSRASLFRPSWVGAWTFWALLTGLMVAVVIAGLAIWAAARADETERGGG